MEGQCSWPILQMVLIVWSLHILKASGSGGIVEFADDPPTCTTTGNSDDTVFNMKATIKTSTNASISKFEYIQGHGLYYNVAVNNGSMTSDNGTHVIRFTVGLIVSKAVGCQYYITGDDVIRDDVAQQCDVSQYVNMTDVKCSTATNINGSETHTVGHSGDGRTTNSGNTAENVSQPGIGRQTATSDANFFPVGTPDSTYYHKCRLAMEKSDQWEPLMIAVIVHTFVTFTTIVLVYMYLVGKVERRRKNKRSKENNENKEIKKENKEIQENKEKPLAPDSDATTREKRHVAFDVPYVSSLDTSDISSDMTSIVSTLSSTTVSTTDSWSSGGGSTDTTLSATTVSSMSG